MCVCEIVCAYVCALLGAKALYMRDKLVLLSHIPSLVPAVISP